MSKKNRRIWWIVLALVVQSAALGAICYQREAILQKGQTVYMRTLPIDPRDLFRGDYVRLNYEAATLSADLAPNWVVAQKMQKAAQRIYLSFAIDAKNRLVPEALSFERPSEGHFVRGYTKREYRKNKISVKFGLEKYFVQQGKGGPLERGRRLKGVRLPLEMAVSVGETSGIAVLRGHRYAKLGMGLTFSKAVKSPGKPHPVVTVRLINASATPIQIVDPLDHGSFVIKLESPAGAGSEKNQLRFIELPQPKRQFLAADVKVLAPNQLYEVKIDLTDARYALMRGDQPLGWHQMDYSEAARIEYTPPTVDQIQGLDTAIELWQGRIASRPFSGRRFSR